MPVTSRHHLFYPANAYKTPLERKFRQLPCNITRIDHRVHQMLHLYQKPPTKPSPQAMRRSVELHNHGECGCNSMNR